MFAPLPYGVSLAGWYFIGIQLVLVWFSYRSRGAVARMKALPSRTRHFATTIVMQVLYLSLSLLVARSYRVDFFPPRSPKPLAIAAGLGAAVVLAFGMYPLWRKAVLSRTRRIHFFTPKGARERVLWVGVSLAAGIGEEVTYRGMLFLLLWTLTGSPWTGAILSALVFAGGHAFQSKVSMVIIFGFALLFQALALWTGTLYVSMLGHVVYDIIAGFMYAKLARELGYVPDVPEASGAEIITPQPTPP
jgi:membrane protease YdiL (CAAX protease family)